MSNAGDGNGGARRDQPRRQPRVRVSCLRADEDQQSAAEQAATDRPHRQRERSTQFRVAEGGIAVANRERPSRLQHMQSGRRSPERADNDKDRETEHRLHHAVARQRAQRRAGCRGRSIRAPLVEQGLPTTRRGDVESEPWRQPQPIDRSNRDHGEKERDLCEQKPAVVGPDQSWDAAGQEPAVDAVGRDEHADADQAERREAQRSLARERKRNPLAPCRREQQRERQQAAEPGRRGDQMQPVSRAMEGAEPTGRRRGVTGMDRCGGKRAGEQRRDRPAPEIQMLWRDPTQGCGEQRRQHEPREPIMSESGVEEHRPHNAAEKSFARRALVDVRGEHDQPRHPRDQGGGKTPPRNAQQPRAQGFTPTLH